MRETSSENQVDAELRQRYEKLLKKLAEKELEASLLRELVKKQNEASRDNK